MSGPKTSYYKLTPAQREIIRKQRELDRKLRDEKAYRLKLLERAKSLSGAFAADRHNAELLKEHSDGDNGFTARADVFSLKVSELIKQIDYGQFYSELEDFQKARESAEKALAELLEEKKALEDIAAANCAALSQALNSRIDAGFSAEVSGKKTQPSDKLTQMKERYLYHIHRLLAEPLLSETLRNELSAAEKKLGEITDREFLKNYISVSVAGISAQCEAYLSGIDEYNRLSARYESLCDLCGEIAEDIPYSSDCIAVLTAEIERLETLLVEQSEQAYISQCIDEVMADMGYNLLGTRSVSKKSGAKFRSELYSYNDGAAVNVTYSADGKITMELGGLDTADRLPTPAEADRLRGDMEGFCDEYDEFERRLAEKGVIPEHIALLPPDTEYAQIINTIDYELCEGASVSNISDRKRTFAADLTMRNDSE